VTLAERFGKNLAAARHRAGLSQEDVAFRAELHRTAVGQLERGERCPRLDTFVKLVGTLAVTPAALLDGLAWEPGSFQPGGFRDAGEAES
jgi:transcriptional regulator with XRE-family HTH domain